MGRTTKTAMTRAQRETTDDTEPTQLLHDLELRHHNNNAKSTILVKDEDIRRLRVRIFLLRDENTALRDQVEESNSLNAKLTSQYDNLTVEIEKKMVVIRNQQETLRKQEREYKNLKAELQTMNTMSENSTNILSEKLALARELSNLKPEIEHLRSQVNHQQEILAEKLALERQVNTLEVELENEKKARKRTMESRQSNDRVEDELRKKLRETEKKLTAETAERERLEDQLEQRIKSHSMVVEEQDSIRQAEADARKKLQEAQRQLREEIQAKENLEEQLQTALRASKKSQANQAAESAEAELRAELEESQTRLSRLQEKYSGLNQAHQTAVAEIEGRNEQLEKKMEKMRTKYRELQEELKKTQAELRKAQQQQTQQARSYGAEDSKLGTKTLASRKKRGIETSMGEFTHIEIQTPSADAAMKSRRAIKKPIVEPSLVGRKSAFSVTPLLNRGKNTSMSEEGSKLDDEALEDSILGARSESRPSESLLSQSEPSTSHDVESESTAVPTHEEVEQQPVKVPKARGRPKKALIDAPSAKQNALSQKVPKKILKATKSKLQEIPESTETNGPESETAKEPGAAEKKTTVKFDLSEQQQQQEEGNSTASVQNGEQPKKKKRKVLGSTKTLFDDDDGEVPAPVPVKKPQLGVKRAKAALGGHRNAFAGAATTFSPLKRDRRGVGASFLA
ncbi:hypothetical protein F5Y17DRAFT_447211 [Xylariaceae sp. FL0594]|nr:hypothetical protein F5Y17DRAFT_447211 [Xylariaceae sp. FL0594]